MQAYKTIIKVEKPIYIAYIFTYVQLLSNKPTVKLKILGNYFDLIYLNLLFIWKFLLF